jgi:BirA family transcriptional regulator, biotin operon repressor / biotin---[acetyl-CoA-carboxylase] ligase
MPATSLSSELGRPVSLASLVERLLFTIEGRYAALRHGWTPWREWAAHLVTLGKAVTVSTGEREWTGFAVGVDQDGALRVRLADGRIVRVVAEDVTLRSELGWRQPGRSDTMLWVERSE